MEAAGGMFQQLLTMAIHMLVCFCLFGGKIAREGSKPLANLLAWRIMANTV